MRESLLILDKPRGLTPLDHINAFKRKNPEYASEKIGYAGRLDPMAEGLMLYLVGDANTRRDQYLGLDKEYVVEILFGFSTDSYDLLGKVTEMREYDSTMIREHTVKNMCKSLVGVLNQQYPPYSAKTVDGKSLYYWARHGDTTRKAFAEREIYSCECEGIFVRGKHELKSEIGGRVRQVRGDFRQVEIQELWDEKFVETTQSEWVLATVRVSCSSGTFMRSLAVEIGLKLQLPACAYSIRRTRVGQFTQPSL